MKKHTLITGGLGFIFATLILGLYFKTPKTYQYQNAEKNFQNYIFLFEEEVHTLSFEAPLSFKPGKTFSYSEYEVESTTKENSQTTYTLKPTYPGEKGEEYRITMLQDTDYVFYKNNQYLGSSFLRMVFQLLIGI